MEVFIGRQPIFNKYEQIVAYELLYRSKEKESLPIDNPDAATIHVIVNSLVSIGMEEVTKGKPAFINFTESLLEDEIIEYLDPALIVIEILETVSMDEKLVANLASLKERGFKIALDDFILASDEPIYHDIFAYVDYIKVDFLNSTVQQRMDIENKVKLHFPSIQLLAEKVETRAHYESALQTGYVLFQGYFFEKPKVLIHTEIPANLIQYLQVMSILRDDEPDINDLAENIERDISMSYKLLQLINSRHKRTRSKVRSIKQAILMLGLVELRKWIYLLAMRETTRNPDSDIFNELMRVSLFRAKVCEQVARSVYKENYSEYFLIGLFSLIDSLLNRPLNVVLASMPFAEEIVDTLSGKETEMTVILKLSIALCKLDWEALEQLGPLVGLDDLQLIELYDEVDYWVTNTYNI